MVQILDVYGEDFQLNIIRAIINDTSFFRSVREFLKPEHFTVEFARIPYLLICEFFDKYHYVPTFSVLQNLVKAHLYDRQMELNVVCTELYRLEHDKTTNDDYIQDQVINFCKIQEAEAVFYDQQKLMDQAKQSLEHYPNFEKIYKRWERILKLSKDPINSDSIARFREMFTEEKRRNCISTGYNMLDFLLDGGYGGGELHTIAAYSGRGKTTHCMNIAANCYKLGYKILFFTFENNDVYINKALYSRITDIPLIVLKGDMLDVAEKELIKYSGGLHVKYYSMMKYTPLTILQYYEKLRDDGYDADLIIIDSPLHLLSTQKSNSKWETVGYIYKELKGMSQELNKPFLVTCQLGKGAAQIEEAETENTGDAFSIVQDSDSWMSINRSKEQMISGKGTYYLGKQRFGPDRLGWPMIWRNSTRKIEEDNSVMQIIGELKTEQFYKNQQEVREAEKELNNGNKQDNT